MLLKFGLVFGITATLGLWCVGCSKSAGASGGAVATTATAESAGEHSHESWWCAEHGVPEEVCTKCNPKLVVEFKAKGDWCKEHDCPESQCFICHPERKAEFAALYEAKFGKEPPATDGVLK